MKKLFYPLGEQNFRQIREDGKVYVDKTGFIQVALENKWRDLFEGIASYVIE